MSRSSGPPNKADPKSSLLELHVETGYELNAEKTFEDNPVRIALKKVGFDPDSTYGILKTVFNPDAAEVLRSHYSRGASRRREFHGLIQSSCDVYMDALDHLVRKAGIKHATYPMVKNGPFNDMYRHDDQPFWPIAHMIRGDDSDVQRFRCLVARLHDDDAFDFIKKRDAPQNYDMPHVKVLRNSSVPPILVEEDLFFVRGEELKRMVDFLCPYRYSHKWKSCGNIIDMD